MSIKIDLGPVRWPTRKETQFRGGEDAGSWQQSPRRDGREPGRLPRACSPCHRRSRRCWAEDALMLHRTDSALSSPSPTSSSPLVPSTGTLWQGGEGWDSKLCRPANPLPTREPQGSGWLSVPKELEATQLKVASRGHLIDQVPN